MGESLAAQTSLPNPTFESLHPHTSEKRTSQSPSRKHLRYEAAELVRSLQSSRTSLEKAGLGSNPGSYSSGTLGRRLGRPYSPGMKDKGKSLGVMLDNDTSMKRQISAVKQSSFNTLQEFCWIDDPQFFVVV